VFRRKGSCPAGDNCPFRHVRPSSSASTSSSLLTSKQGSADLLSVEWENKSNSDAAAGNAVLEKAVPLRKEKGICNTVRRMGVKGLVRVGSIEEFIHIEGVFFVETQSYRCMHCGVIVSRAPFLSSLSLPHTMQRSSLSCSCVCSDC